MYSNKQQPKGKEMKHPLPKYKYYTVGTKHRKVFESFTDIAAEYKVTKGAVAGKFYRTKTNIIYLGKDKIIRKLKLDKE